MANINSATIFNDDFLFTNKTAKNIYFDYIKDLPIIDYHNHLSPFDLANDTSFSNLYEIWLKGDHYKWRVMRTLGFNEKYVTGTATDKEKFIAWANCLPQTIRNPIFHWSHLELKNTFGINQYLNESTADLIFQKCNELLQKKEYSVHSILKKYNVQVVGTTDDPCDDLMAHQQSNNFNNLIKVVPTFRPDKFLNISDKQSFINNIEKLEIATGIKINSINYFLSALESRINYFHEAGCRASDHGLQQMPSKITFTTKLETEFKSFMDSKNKLNFSDPERFFGAVLYSLCRMYNKKGWVQQFHLGPIRNNNSRMLKLVGVDAGTDSIGDYNQAENLSKFLNELDFRNDLAKTILYNINPADNEVFASMCGNFNDGSVKGKIQFGSAWWFLDQKEGIENQINTLSNLGVVSSFIGMTTDSRSFLSFSRHEYFRRIICNMFGSDMEKGLIPNDENWISSILQNICYHNAKNYFNFHV